MTTPINDTEGSRNLPFPLKEPLASENADVDETLIPVLTPSMFPIDSDERITVQFELSLNEFVALASALDVGRDPAYGLESYKIWWIWVRSFVGLPNINDCGDVADCFESEIVTNQTLINSVANTVNASGFGNPNHINPQTTTYPDRSEAGAAQQNILPMAVCNLDQLWAGIRHGIVARLDDNGRDMLEDLALIPDTLERLEVFIDVVPIIGDLAEALAFQVTEIIPDLLDLYNSASSETFLDETACAIFDLVCAECRYPTFEEVFNYYFSNSISGVASLTDATLEDIAQHILDIIGNPAEAAYNTIIYWQLWTLLVGATFNQVSGSGAIILMAELGEDFANDNWKDLCSGCDDAYMVQTYDYRVAQGNSYKTGGFSSIGGTYVPGKGWRVDKINATGGRLTMAQPIESSWTIRAVAYQTSVPKTDIVSFAGEFRTIAGSTSGATGINWSLDTSPNPNARCRQGLASISNFMEFALSLTKDPITEIFLEKIVIIFNRANSPSTGVPSPSQLVCDII